MDVIEKAIRNALEKGNAADKAFREKVYRQAFAALDKVLQANPGITVEAAMRRRKALQADIVEIEKQYLPGRARPVDDLNTPTGPLPTSATPAVELDRRDSAQRADAPVPEISLSETNRRVGGRVDPVVAVDEAADSAASTDMPNLERTERRVEETLTVDGPPERRRRNRFASFFVAATLFSALAMGIWWAIQTGLIGKTDELEPMATQQPQPPEDFEPGADTPPVQAAQATPEREWVTVFSPTDTDALSAPSDASAEIMKGETGSFVRIKSGASGSAIVFDIGQGVLEKIAGKKATFDIVARAEDGKQTQMSVICNFGELGDCGRKRYAVGNARGDYLFELDVADKRPGAGGTIAINSDFDNAGKSVDIYEIKVSTGE